MISHPMKTEPAVDPKRSALMAMVLQKNTKPELTVRRLVYSLGYRYRLHRRDMPGTPDIVFGRLRRVILVHGCFWHRHSGCKKTTTPKTRRAFWVNKFEENVERDRRNLEALRSLDWQCYTVWGCQCGDLDELRTNLVRFLEEGRTTTVH